MKEKNKKFYNYFLGLIPSLTLLVAIVALVVSVWVFATNVKISENLNRPYIEIDMSRMKEIETTKINPEEFKERFNKKLPIPYINYLDFSIKNVGKLPAKYTIDVSEFKELGLVEIIPQVNCDGFIFPGQIIPTTYYIKGKNYGENYKEKSREELKRQQNLIAGDIANASKIKVIYGYLSDHKNDFNFEIVIAERMIEKGGEFPNERLDFIMKGYSRKWFVVSTK